MRVTRTQRAVISHYTPSSLALAKAHLVMSARGSNSIPCEMEWKRGHGDRICPSAMSCQKSVGVREMNPAHEGRDVQVAFVEVHIFCPDMGRLAYTQAGPGQEKKDTSLSVVLGGLEQSAELCMGEKFLGLHDCQDGPYPTSNF